MPAHVQVVPCPQKQQIIEKFARSVPCPQGKPKKKKAREVPCPEMEQKRASKHIEDMVSCPSSKNGQKRVQQIACSGKQQERARNGQRVPCSGERKKSPKGCPKCENDRIERLECEVYQLRREIQCLKEDRKAAERAVGRAIIRGARALGGRFKPVVPESIEKLLDSCDSDASSLSTSASVTFCSTKTAPVAVPCRNKTKKEEFVYCE